MSTLFGALAVLFSVILFTHAETSAPPKAATDECEPERVYVISVDQKSGDPNIEEKGIKDTRYPRGVVWYQSYSKEGKKEWQALPCGTSMKAALSEALYKATEEDSDLKSLIEAQRKGEVIEVSSFPKVSHTELVPDAQLEKNTNDRGVYKEKEAQMTDDVVPKQHSSQERINSAFSALLKETTPSTSHSEEETPAKPVEQKSAWQHFMDRIAPPFPADVAAKRREALEVRKQELLYGFYTPRESSNTLRREPFFGRASENTYTALKKDRVIGLLIEPVNRMRNFLQSFF